MSNVRNGLHKNKKNNFFQPFQPAFLETKDWSGPMWNGKGHQMVWQLDTEWSNREKPLERNPQDEHPKVMNLYNFEQKNVLSQADYVWLAERGYIKISGNYEKDF